jgi:putative ABC transport system permease protein
MIAGRWLRPDDTNAVVLNNLVPAAQAPGAKVGDTITLTINGRPTTWHVVGIASDFGTQGTAYLTDHEYAHIAGGTRMVRVVTTGHDPAARQATLDRIEHGLAAAGIGIEQDYTVDTLRSGLDGHVLVLAEALIAIAAVMGFVGLLGPASVLSTNVIERTREFAVLHVIGAMPAAVRGIVVTEGLFTGLLSIAVGLLAALPLTRLLGDFIGTQAFRQALPYQFSTGGLLLWSLLALAGAAGASTAACGVPLLGRACDLGRCPASALPGAHILNAFNLRREILEHVQVDQVGRSTPEGETPGHRLD